jgi:hypothetical protein
MSGAKNRDLLSVSIYEIYGKVVRIEISGWVVELAMLVTYITKFERRFIYSKTVI